MKKNILILFLFFTNLTFAQQCFTFDARFIDCIDKWVILPQEQDWYYTYGYVFLDENFDLIFQKEGIFEIREDCNFYSTKAKKVTKTKLTPSKALVSVISEDKFSELKIFSELKSIKKPKESAENYFHLGFFYNAWGENQKALAALTQAKALNPKIEGLEKEIAFSYNSSAMYDKAIEILQTLREKQPKDAYIYRELIFALTKSGKLKEAVYNLRHSISVCKEKKYHGENCLNVIYQAFLEEDQKIFFQFVRKAKTWNKGNAKALDLIKKLEEEMKTKK